MFSVRFLFTDCGCAGKMPPGYIPDYYNSSEPFAPIATNGQPFPWLHPYLPNNVKPNRYMLTIHPNLTTLDVKGLYKIRLKFTPFLPLILIREKSKKFKQKSRRKRGRFFTYFQSYVYVTFYLFNFRASRD